MENKMILLAQQLELCRHKHFGRLIHLLNRTSKISKHTLLPIQQELQLQAKN